MEQPHYRVLIVDDDPAMRDLLVHLLTTQGHTAVQAVSGEVALALIGVTQSPFDLLITDIHMPGIKGPELAQRVQEIHAGTRVLIVSADEPVSDSCPGSRFLRKPFTAPEFLAEVENAVNDS